MDKKKKKTIIALVVAIVLIIIIAVSALLYYFLGVKKKNPDNQNANNVNNQSSNVSVIEFTNTYNTSILEHILSTTEYSGTYKLSTVQAVEFNTISDDNPNGLTQENIKELYKKHGTNDANGFNKYLLDRRKEKADVFNLNSTMLENGNVADYGIFTASSMEKKYKTSTGKVYGDKNLAVIVFDDKEYYDTENFFINNKTTNTLFVSLTYGDKISGTTNLVSSSNSKKSKTIYVFENIYSTNNPKLRLFTVVYAYTLEPINLGVESDDLDF